MNVLYVLQVLIGFGFVIAIHEAGHFFAAKRVGINCPAFSIGFPMPIWTPKGWKVFNIFKFKWRGTEYRLGWIPFGGYVQMQGQSDSPGQIDKAKEDDKGDYRNKTYFQKTQVLLGGVTMNAITAVIGFILAFQLGVTFIEPTVGMVDTRSSAWTNNEIQVGDKILEVNGREVVDFEDVVYAGIFDGGDSIDLLVEREKAGEKARQKITLSLDEDPVFGIKMPGIKAKHRVVLTGDEADRFPETLGEDRPQDGDELVAVDGRVIRNVYDAKGFIEQSRGAIMLTLRRGFGEDARDWQVPYTPRRHFFTDSGAYAADISIIPAPFVNRVRKGGPADVAGLREGDKFVAVAGPNGDEKLHSFGDLTRVVDASNGNQITLVLEREGARHTVDIRPEPRESSPGRFQLGLTISPIDTRGLNEKQEAEKIAELAGKLVAYGVRPGSQAALAGLVPGDKIVGIKVGGVEKRNPETEAVDGEALEAALIAASQSDQPAEITFQVERNSGLLDVTVKPDDNGQDSGAYLLMATAEQRSEPVTYGLLESVKQGFYHSKKVGYKIIMTLGALFTGRVKIWHLGGPVVIAKRSYSLAQWGTGTLIFFLAFISINLAIVNLIPLPVLDGGQWLIVTIEAVRGKPLPERAMHWVSLTSFIAVLGLMVFVLANDLVTVFWRKWV